MINLNKVYGLLGLAARSGKVVCGMDAVLDSIKFKKVKLVIVAEDASEKTKKNVKFVCDKNNLKYLSIGLKDDLSHAIGKENKVVFAIKDKNIINGIEKIIYGGDAIG